MVVGKLGSFEVTGGLIKCTDPCYDVGTWCAADIVARDGTWIVGMMTDEIDMWGERVIMLNARHSTGTPVSFEQTDPLGVDSGQFGFFDAVRYPSGGSTGKYDDPTSFYGRCCATTLGEAMGGVLPEGVVSASGLGDGSYVVSVGRDADGRAVSLEVCFFDDEDDGDAEDDSETE